MVSAVGDDNGDSIYSPIEFDYVVPARDPSLLVSASRYPSCSSIRYAGLGRLGTV